MNVYRVSFIGHREIVNSGELEQRLIEIITELLRSKDYVEFQVGRNGEFDILAAACTKRAQQIYGRENSSITLVLPYSVAHTDHLNSLYDSLIIHHADE